MARNRPFRHFLVALVGVFALAVLGSLVTFRAQFGTMTWKTAARCLGAEAKMQAIAALPSPKLVFIGGSAVHMGINTEMLGAALGMPAGNFGTLAALGPKIMLFNASQVLKRGDTAVVVFEYGLYWRNRPTEAEIDFAMGCGETYVRSLSLIEQLQFALGADPLRFLFVRNIPRDEELRRQKQRLTSNGDARFTLFNFSPQDEAQIERMRRYRPANTSFDRGSRDARAIAEFVELAHANGINVLAAWPNTLRFAEYDSDPGLRAIAGFYRELGVPMVGTPQDAMLAFEYLHDTQFHLNKAGIIQRTTTLIGNLRPLVGEDLRDMRSTPDIQAGDKVPISLMNGSGASRYHEPEPGKASDRAVQNPTHLE